MNVAQLRKELEQYDDHLPVTFQTEAVMFFNILGVRRAEVVPDPSGFTRGWTHPDENEPLEDQDVTTVLEIVDEYW